MARRVVVVALNLLLFVVLGEVVAVVYYYLQHRAFFYTAVKTLPAAIPETLRGELSDDALHPYFGPLNRPGVRPETNNVGFASPQAFPVARRDDRQFLVGIFGGSVARQFCDRGVTQLLRQLKRATAFANREIVPLCFGHEGYKQPQQLTVLMYFLSVGQGFDLVINIDGFNEVALGSRNHERGRDVSMPSPIHLDPLLNLIDQSTLTPERAQALGRISVLKERLNWIVEQLRGNQIASVHFALDRYYARTMNRYRGTVASYDRLPTNPPASSMLVLTPPLRPALTDSEVYEEIGSQWAAASLLMRDALAVRNVFYLHVLQPNQYLSGHQFSDAEARVALNDTTPFKAAVVAGYPVLRQAAASLDGREAFFDATTAFDGERAAVYEDDCCHYTDRGYAILADEIAKRVVRMKPRVNNSKK